MKFCYKNARNLYYQGFDMEACIDYANAEEII